MKKMPTIMFYKVILKRFLILLLLILAISCDNQKKADKIRIQRFEEILGKRESEALTKKVEVFEEFLAMNFKDIPIEKAYEKFLQQIKENGIVCNHWKHDSALLANLNTICEESGLRKEIWLKRDSVWYDGDYLCYFYQYVNGNDTFKIANFELTDSGIYHLDYTSGYEENNNRDSILEAEKRVKTFNMNGKFIHALEIVKGSDSTIINYLEIKDIEHDMSPSSAADAILYIKPDYSDYFLKRIIVAELF